MSSCRATNANGGWTERGAWGLSAAEQEEEAREEAREERAAAARREAEVRREELRLLLAEERTVTLYRGDRTAEVHIEDDGRLLVTGLEPHPSAGAIAAAAPDLVQRARRIRELVTTDGPPRRLP